ncbi:hypothetical protein T01_3100 [Trichinella spiralis]|uniref:Uncharacterized protein n=1 Tax=Trichinella spiralis TaxID=6334 RepID=A0A0V1BGH4_TRISP|nr:hypothetical protein T01_3100 [Trichinella spiralis]
MTEREKAGTDGRVIGGRIGGGTRKSRYVLEGRGRGFHYDYTVEIWLAGVHHRIATGEVSVGCNTPTA